VGVADVRDALRMAPERRESMRVEELMRPPLVVPKTAPLHRVLSQMREAGQRLAVVIDEYGGTAGIVTAEDLLEEMAGEIEAQAPPRPSMAGAGRLLPGTAPLDHVLDEVGLELPTGEYSTLAGFLLHRLGDLPRMGDGVEFDGWSLRVASLDGHRIAWVAIQRPAAATT
jgi:putative hemolysin